MMSKFLIPIIFLANILNGQTATSNGLEFNAFHRNTDTRTYTEYYDDKQINIKMIRTVKGRMNHGPYKDFYESGQIRTDANYYNGEFHGPYTFYHENGKVYVQVEYKKGNLSGDVAFYDENGKLIETIKYKNGKPIK
tara:strand:- start:392 stop:802 length:411 start_codon:yes stop_codon:yes gene_type:complete